MAPVTRPPFACRSLLFVPGARPDRFAKALATAADIVCIDLEDAVLPDQKVAAREAVSSYLAGLDAATARRMAVRINGVTTLEGLKDLAALAGRAPATVLLPKTETPRDVEIVTAALGDVGVLPLVETVRGLRAADAIAAAPGTAALMFGGADFAAEIGATMDFEPLLAIRQALVLAAAGAQRPLIDVPHVRIKELDHLAAEAARVATLGFTGKAAIHPTQVDPINAAFSPSAAEVERARAVIETFRTKGVAQLDGEFVEGPIVRRYERILALADHT